MTRRTLPTMPWWGWLLIVWGPATAGAGVIIGAVIRQRNRETWTPQLDAPIWRDSDLYPRTLPTDRPGLAGAILALGFAATEDQARGWLRQCRLRGATDTELAELWARWQADNTPHRLSTNPEDDL
jgi:hypothetical protein